MMKPPSKRMLIAMIVVILIFVVIVIAIPEKESGAANADLVFVQDSDTPVGSVYISFARWDGSSVTEGGMNADSSLLKRGDSLSFDGVAWPVTVTVCSDLQGNEALAQIVIEEAPAEGRLWRVTLVDNTTGTKLILTDAPRG